MGSSLTAISTNRWTIHPQNMIQIDIVPENIGRQYPVSVGILGDAKLALTLAPDEQNKRSVEEMIELLKQEKDVNVN